MGKMMTNATGWYSRGKIPVKYWRAAFDGGYEVRVSVVTKPGGGIRVQRKDDIAPRNKEQATAAKAGDSFFGENGNLLINECAFDWDKKPKHFSIWEESENE